MRVHTLVPDDFLGTLRAALQTGDSVARYADAATLIAAARDRADAIVVDPSILTDAEWARMRPVLSSPDVAVLLYAPLGPNAIKRIVAAATLGVHEVALRKVDDDPAAMRRRLLSLRRPAPPARVFAGIASRIANLPAGLQDATVPLFCAAPIPRWAEDIARTAHLPRRSVDRWMHRAGLAGTATLLDVARLSRVWVPMVVNGASPADVASQGGYVRARMLAAHTRRIVGASPTLLGAQLGVDQFVQRLIQRALRA